MVEGSVAVAVAVAVVACPKMLQNVQEPVASVE